MLKLAVSGACGRMGRRITALAHESGDIQLVAALEAPHHPQLGADAGEIAGVGKLNLPVADGLGAAADVLIDFSLPAGAEKWGRYCAQHRLPLVVGTTGLADAQMQVLRDASVRTPILVGANMSLGVNLLFKLAAQVAAVLTDEYDVEMVETHHRFKRDAPSGTALELARRIATAKGWPFPDCLTHGRQGKDALRQTQTIGMHAVRAGDVVGDHSVVFSTLGETLTLHHQAHSRDTFARGALRAARWLVGRPAGWYGMADVLGL